MFLVTTAKLAHLKQGDPFKERCGLYCFLILETVLSYMNHMLEEIIAPVEEEAPPRSRLGQLTQGFVDRVIRKLTSKTRGGVVIDGVPREMIEEVKAMINRTRRAGVHAENRYPLLQYHRTEFRVQNEQLQMLADHVIDRDAHVQAVARLNTLHQLLDVVDTHNQTVEVAIRTRAKFRILQQHMRQLRNVLHNEAQAYYEGHLGGNLNVDAYVHAVMRIRQSQRPLKFKFTDIVELQGRVVRAIDLFYERTEGLVDERFVKFNLHVENEDRLDYIVVLRRLMNNGDCLDPFEDDINLLQVVIPRNQQPPATAELIDLGADLAPVPQP